MRTRSQGKIPHKKTVIDGEVFDSAEEGRYWLYLRDQLAKGKITKIERQVLYRLVVQGHDGKPRLQGTWKADFLVTFPDGYQEIHEWKGYANERWPAKRKLIEALIPIPLVVRGAGAGRPSRSRLN